MTLRTPPRALRQFRYAMSRQHDAAASDAQLLERYVSGRDEAAFAALVYRHGPMVLGVCRRVLRNAADADDAFQATFLVLVVKAASIRSRALLGNWLYGVAYNTARKALATSRTRRAKEAQAGPEAREPGCPETQAAVDAELAALPEKYRAAVVACDLEGKTIKDAAAHLGVPPGTVATRLRRGRALLAARLQARGVGLAPGVFATPAVPAALVGATVEAGTRLAAGEAVAESISILVEGVLKSMLVTKLKASLVVFAVVFLGLGGSLLSQSKPPPPAATAGKREDGLKNTLLALDKHLWEAFTRGDWQERQKFLADDFVSISVLGKHGKADAAAAEKGVRCGSWSIRDAELTRVSKDVAVLTYLYDCKLLAADGKEREARAGHRLTSVWANRNGGWVIVHRHDDHGRPPQQGATWNSLYSLHPHDDMNIAQFRNPPLIQSLNTMPYLNEQNFSIYRSPLLGVQLKAADLNRLYSVDPLAMNYDSTITYLAGGVPKPVPLPVGEWAVEYSNGVTQVTTFAKDGAVTVAQLERKATGKAESKDGGVVVRYDDDRVERWVPAGDRMVVEHWFPGSSYPNGRPVLGVAERRKVERLVAVALKHLTADDAVKRIQTLYGAGRVSVTANARTNSVLVHGTEERVGKIKQILRDIDVSKP